VADVPYPELGAALAIVVFIEARVERTLKRVLELSEETRGRRRADRDREQLPQVGSVYGRRRDDRRRPKG
jgi:hypothetical protein